MIDLVNEQLANAIDQASLVMSERSSPVLPTYLARDELLSKELEADIWLASELHQVIGAYKIRGAYNFFHNLDFPGANRSVVTASAGNHAQGIALSARLMGIKSDIFMPKTTPKQKIARVAFFGEELTNIHLVGQSFDEAQERALSFVDKQQAVFASPFNDLAVIAGQGTWGREIVESIDEIDTVLAPVGGMGLLAGVSTAIKAKSPRTKIIGVEPKDAASLSHAIDHGRPVAIKEVDNYIDGASVSRVGTLPYRLASHLIDSCLTVSNFDVRRATTDLWEREVPINVELASALSIAGLRQLGERIAGKRVVCLLSGGNLSRERYQKDVRLSQELSNVGI